MTAIKQNNYKLLNEGLGGAYERIAYSNVIRRIARQLGCKSVLELNATYIAGIPGFNSCLLAQCGEFDEIHVTVHDRDYEDARHVWKLTGMSDDIFLYNWNNDNETFFKDNSIDLVFNHLAFEHEKYSINLVKEMARIARVAIINLTLSPYNLGFVIHWINHKIRNDPWDHGYFKNTLISTMEQVHKQAGLEVIENGVCDVPPWLDTVDSQIGGSMTYLDNYPKSMRNNWNWCSIDPECQQSWIVSLLWSWEAAMPVWFKKLVGHHLYVASKKVES